MKILTHHCFKSVDESAFLGMMRAVKGKTRKNKKGEKDTDTDTNNKKKTMLALGLSSPFFS